MTAIELIDALRELEASLQGLTLDMYDIIPSTYCPTIAALAEDVLISRSGGCNWDNMDILKEAGYDVFPLERDRFGWLIGGIQTSRGVVSYG